MPRFEVIGAVVALAVALGSAFMLGLVGLGGTWASLTWFTIAVSSAALAIWTVMLIIRRVRKVDSHESQAVKEATLSAIAEIIPGKVFRRIQRTDGRIEFPFFLGAGRRALGLGSESRTIDGAELAAVIHPDDRELRRRAIEESARNLTPYDTEYRICLPSGEVQWVWSKGLPTKLDDGAIAWDCFSLDITDLKNAETALREQEELISSITSRMPGYIYRRILHSDGSEEAPYVSSGPMGLVPPGPGLGDEDIDRIAAVVHPDDRDARELAFKDSARTLTPLNIELRRIHQDGTVRWVRSMASVHRRDNGDTVWDGVAIDITELKQMEQALAESEAQLRAILDHAPIVISLKAPDGRYVMMNRFHERIFSIDVAASLGHTVRHVFGSRIADRVEVIDREVMSNRKPVSFEINSASETGEIRVLLETKFPVLHTDGSLLGLGTVALDITDRKKADVARREGDARFRAIVDNAPAIVTLKDTDFRYLLVNPPFLEWWGLKESEVLGRTREELPSAQNLISQDEFEREVLKSGEPRSYETQVLGADGTVRIALKTKFPIPGLDGQPSGIGTFVQDITGLKGAEAALVAAEERFRQFAESASDWMWETDEQHCFTFLSDRRQAVLGHTSEEALGKTRQEMVNAPTDTPEWRKHLADLEARRPFRDFEILHLDAKERMHTVSISGNPIFNGDGTFVGYRGTARDVTDERGREAQLVQAQKMQAIGELTGGIAHDFNNLLGVVLTNLDLLSETLSNEPEALRIVDRAVRATLRGADLTRGLVAFARKQSLRPEITELNALIVEVLEFLDRTLGATIVIRPQLAGELWRILVDRGQMESALVNLSVNARDAMPGGGHLEIVTANVTLGDRIDGHPFRTRPGDYVRLSIKDTGEGIEAAHLNRVFEPFFTTKEVGKGSGLGLSMVFGFVKQSDGYIAIDSVPGKGTTISLYLPRLSALEDVSADALSAPDGTASWGGDGRKILVVEDEDSVRQMVVSILTGLGYQADEARTGMEAIASLGSEGRPDLLFTDMVLPGGMNGLDIAREARQMWPDLPVLFTTGYTRDALELTRDDNTGFLRKPYRRSDLAETIHGLIDAAETL